MLYNGLLLVELSSHDVMSSSPHVQACSDVDSLRNSCLLKES